MLHTKVHGNWSTGAKEDFKAFYHIRAWKPSGHVTYITLTFFISFVPKSVHKIFVNKCHVVDEKNKVSFR